MDDQEKKYREELKANGVDLPEEESDTEEVEDKDESKDEPKKPEQSDDQEKADDSEDHLQKSDPQDQKDRKPSIYDRYKDEKSSRREAETRAEQAERERDELKAKLDEASKAKGSGEEKETIEDAIAYAKKVGADPDLVKRIIEDARKDMKPELDPEMKARLDRFDAWEKSNAKTIEAQRFTEEFESILPSLKEQFPNASDEEVKAIKTELDAISHTKEFHDKDLDYVAFKNRDKLAALVSPKKRGFEPKGKKDGGEIGNDFDPAADLSKMSPKEREAWEAEYRKLGKTDGLMTDARGRKSMI